MNTRFSRHDGAETGSEAEDTLAVAASYDYFKNLETFRRIASAVLAVILWPLLLLGIDLHIKK